MVTQDTQGILEQVVIRAPREFQDILDTQALEALAGIRGFLVSLANRVTPASKVFQATLDVRVSRDILDYPVFLAILDNLVYLDIPGSKVSVVIRDSLVHPDTVDLKVSLDTQESQDIQE